METTLQANKGRYDALGPLGASLLFHALLIAVLNGTSSFDFTVGNQTRFDILWFGPADLASPSTQVVSDVARAVAPPAQLPPEPGEDQDDLDPSSRNVPTETEMENYPISSSPAMDVTGALALAIPAAAEIHHQAAPKRREPARAENKKVFPAAAPATASQSTPQKKKHEPALPGQPELTKKPENSASGTLADSSASAEEKERAKRAKAEHRPELETTAAPNDQASPPQLEVFQILPGPPARPASADAARREPPVDAAATRAARVITTPAPEASRSTAAKAQVQAAPKVMPPSAHPVKIAAAAKPVAPPPAKAPAPKAVKPAAPTTPTAAAPQATVKSQRPLVAVKAATPRAAAPTATATATAAKAPASIHPRMMAKESAAPAPAAAPPLPAPAAAKKAAVEKADGKAAGANHEGGKGVVLSSLKGDLKLVLAGDPALRLTISFREFPRSRRNRTQNRAEARNLKRVQPIFAKSGQQTREAVIGTAREGVYIFAVEPEHAAPAQGSFTLKLYESGAREKVVRIGPRTVSSRTIIARVLMPEGILWDDDSAFSGSMEDSDSTTKFNTQTGLYWKEYND